MGASPSGCFARWWRRVAVSFPLFLLAPLVWCGGCTSHGGRLDLEPAGSDRTLTQHFSSAFITQARGGEYDVVLVDHAEFERQKPTKPLQPQPLSPTRQVMHLHLYWRPLSGATRNPAGVNAAIDWYVLGSDEQQDVIVYEGAGVVTVNGSGRQRQVVITDGTVRPKEARGEMQDPIGRSRISGTFTADVNRTRVRETLAEMRALGPTPPQATSLAR
jgi:hypothetical protein